MDKNIKPYLDHNSNIVFTSNSKGVYNPTFMNFDSSSGNAEVIARKKIYMELVEWVNYARRYTNKISGKKESKPLFPYQWSCMMLAIEALLNPKSQQFLWALARQAGKSTSFELLVPFALTILPKYVEVDSLRFTAVIGSYKNDAVDELVKKIRPFIYKAIDFYNKRNKDQLLCYYYDKSLKLIDASNLLEIDKRFQNGEVIPYSQMRSITCGATSDGYTSNLSCIDEGGLIKADLFQTSMSNFTSATAGITVYSGVPNEDSSSLFYAKKRDTEVRHLLYDYPIVRDMKGMVSKKLSEAYESDYLSKVRGNSGGEQSSYIRWNYYLDTEDTNGKFMSKKTLLSNNLTRNEIRPLKGRDDVYTVAGIDVSASGDYKVITLGETRVYEQFDTSTKRPTKVYKSEVCDMKSLNKLGQKQSGEEFAKECAKVCKDHKVDCVAVDSSSAGGKIFTQLFRKALSSLGVRVMILPYSYNQNKQFLFGFLEQNLYNDNISLLKEDQSWESAKLIEEMCYMLKKHVTGTTYVKYEAPKGSGFTDDHVNSLALFNICIKELYERAKDRKKCVVDDGSGNPWRLRLTKFSMVGDEPTNIGVNLNICKTLYEVPI
ncbi:MAG: hypothetical protein ACRC0F_00965 [Cetobacterium sp.]